MPPRVIPLPFLPIIFPKLIPLPLLVVLTFRSLRLSPRVVGSTCVAVALRVLNQTLITSPSLFSPASPPYQVLAAVPVDQSLVIRFLSQLSWRDRSACSPRLPQTPVSGFFFLTFRGSSSIAEEPSYCPRALFFGSPCPTTSISMFLSFRIFGSRLESLRRTRFLACGRSFPYC